MIVAKKNLRSNSGGGGDGRGVWGEVSFIKLYLSLSLWKFKLKYLIEFSPFYQVCALLCPTYKIRRMMKVGKPSRKWLI